MNPRPEVLFDIDVESNMDFHNPAIWTDCTLEKPCTAMYALLELAAVAIGEVEKSTRLDALVLIKLPIE